MLLSISLKRGREAPPSACVSGSPVKRGSGCAALSAMPSGVAGPREERPLLGVGCVVWAGRLGPGPPAAVASSPTSAVRLVHGLFPGRAVTGSIGVCGGRQEACTCRECPGWQRGGSAQVTARNAAWGGKGRWHSCSRAGQPTWPELRPDRASCSCHPSPGRRMAVPPGPTLERSVHKAGPAQSRPSSGLGRRRGQGQERPGAVPTPSVRLVLPGLPDAQKCQGHPQAAQISLEGCRGCTWQTCS